MFKQRTKIENIIAGILILTGIGALALSVMNMDAFQKSKPSNQVPLEANTIIDQETKEIIDGCDHQKVLKQLAVFQEKIDRTFKEAQTNPQLESSAREVAFNLNLSRDQLNRAYKEKCER